MMLFAAVDPFGVAYCEESSLAVLYSVPAMNDEADWKGVMLPASNSSRRGGNLGIVAGVAYVVGSSVLDEADPKRAMGSSSRTGRTVIADE